MPDPIQHEDKGTKRQEEKKEIEGTEKTGRVPLPRAEDLHPCTDCARLNVGDYCSSFRRVMPEPSKPNACKRFEPLVRWS